MSEWLYDARYWISRPGRMSWKLIHLSSLALLILCGDGERLGEKDAGHIKL